MTCDCIHRYDCGCNPPDPSTDPDEGALYCANCFARIGEACDECAEYLRKGVPSVRQVERGGP